MGHADSLFATYAREATFCLGREDCALPRERDGRWPALAYFGDHLQFPPVPNKNELFAPLGNTSQEHRVGSSIFRNVKYVFLIAANDAIQRSGSYTHPPHHAHSGRPTIF